MPTHLAAAAALPLAAVALGAIFLLAVAGVAAGRGIAGEARAWRGSSVAALLLVAVAAAIGLYASDFGTASTSLGVLLHFGAYGALQASLRLDGLTAIMLGLVGFIAWVIVRYSRHYLDGDPRRMHFLAWLNLTVAAVALLVVSNNLLVLAAAWTGASLALHQLLIFYAERSAALLAAHKKFLLSRIADVVMLGAVFLIGKELGTLEIDALGQALAAKPALTPGLQWAAVLLAGAVILRCAQLPFHGWLIQVMEAPTPVSALLHAGIVNIGGFVMIRLAAFMAPAEYAQLLLVVCGGLTALLASLVMLTRVSIKVSLAWSTCAQMGFMLMECGLGAYSLALLHLVGHSLYKAHAFLSSGNVVAAYRVRRLAPAEGTRPMARWLLAHVLYLPLVLGLVWVVAPGSLARASDWVLFGVLSLALCSLYANALSARSVRIQAIAAAAGLALSAVYMALHQAFASFLALPDIGYAPAAVAAALAMIALYGAFSAIRLAPASAFSRWLYPRAYAGFHLDEAFTRLSLRLWPARLHKRRPFSGAPRLKTVELPS